jgi:tRNA-splicing ligase RtcB (3'-phosphate/5'-hydroxy nucleic acid ligase)
MGVALAYADANRRTIMAAVVELVNTVLRFAPDSSREISCVHNFLRRETHGGAEPWVHRMGAISARVGEPGIVPGSMGTPTFQVALRDEAPGAYKDIGRVMRAQAELTKIVRRLRAVLSYKGAGS